MKQPVGRREKNVFPSSKKSLPFFNLPSVEKYYPVVVWMMARQPLQEPPLFFWATVTSPCWFGWWIILRFSRLPFVRIQLPCDAALSVPRRPDWQLPSSQSSLRTGAVWGHLSGWTVWHGEVWSHNVSFVEPLNCPSEGRNWYSQQFKQWIFKLSWALTCSSNLETVDKTPLKPS